MFFPRRDRRGADRYTLWRAGLLFLAAGVWIGGVRAEKPLITGAAVVILIPAFVLGFLGKGSDDD